MTQNDEKTSQGHGFEEFCDNVHAIQNDVWIQCNFYHNAISTTETEKETYQICMEPQKTLQYGRSSA